MPELYAGIRAALAAHAQAVGCHMSHLYPSGSSLYFTFLISGADDREAEERYLAAWDQAVRRCAAAGGTITHHHGVGRLKARYLAADLGEPGVDVLRRIRAARLGRFLGAARYAGGFALTLPGFRPAQVRLDADGHAFGWRAFNVVVANSRFYGGGMQISPKSDPGEESSLIRRAASGQSSP